MTGLTGPQYYLYKAQEAGFGRACVLGGSLIVKGTCDIEKLQHAANEVLRINDVLRTRVVTDENGQPAQFIAGFEPREFKVVKFRDLRELDKKGGKWAQKPFRMGEDQELVEMQIVQMPDAYGALVRIHHIISDGWTCMLLADQFLSIVNGGHPEAFRYEEFTESEKRFRESKRFARGREFFEEQKKRLPEKTYLSPGRPLRPAKHWATAEMSEGLSDEIKAYAALHNVSVYSLFVTAVAAWMSRKLGRDDFFVGSVVMNRAGIREKNTAGLFATTIPLLLECDKDASFAENIGRMGEKLVGGYRYHKSAAGVYPFGEAPYDLWLSYQTAKISSDPSARAMWYPCAEVGNVMTLSITDTGSERLTLQLEHNVKYPDKAAAEMIRQIPDILAEGIRNDSCSFEDIIIRAMGE
ncbi:MAG: hypothetical protein IKE74_01310 [Mogibacterium sp.]|nr:hypothetical protein [Mogibacterium sp.]